MIIYIKYFVICVERQHSNALYNAFFP